jgi:hypothetical protein
VPNEAAIEENPPMIRITLDSVLREKLHNLTEPLELCDEAGQVLAHLTPAISPSRYQAAEPQISKEELLRRRQNKGNTSSTSEVLAYLETL